MTERPEGSRLRDRLGSHLSNVGPGDEGLVPGAGDEYRPDLIVDRNLAEEMRNKTFREDLYYRLSVGRLRLPPLRDRIEDLPILAELFAREAGVRLQPEAIAPLLAYEWPGNVRELRNMVVRIGVQHERPPELRRSTLKRSPMLFDERGRLRPWIEVRTLATAAAEREYVQEVLQQSDGHLSNAAEIAGITRQSLTIMALKHGLHPRG